MALHIQNPSNFYTAIVYQLRTRSHVTLAVFNALGTLVATLVDEVEGPGERSVNFNGNGLASGEYWYRLVVRPGGNIGQSQSFTQTKKLFLLEQDYRHTELSNHPEP